MGAINRNKLARVMAMWDIPVVVTSRSKLVHVMGMSVIRADVINRNRLVRATVT